MFEDMIEPMSQHMPCKACQAVTLQTLVEYVRIYENLGFIEVIDSWWQCQDCDQTTPVPQGDDDFPF